MNRERIYPWIKKIEGALPEDNRFKVYINKNGSVAEACFPWHHWCGDLGVLYVYDDGGQALQVLESSKLPEDMDEKDLFDLACSNLLRDMEFRFCDTGWGGTGILCDGNFEAASLCCPEIWQFVAEQYAGDFIVGVPARDVVCIISPDDPELLERLKEIVRQILQDGDHTLTDQLFYYSKETGTFSVME